MGSGYSVAFSPDGKTLAAPYWIGGIHLWDAHTGTHLRTLWGHRSDVRSVAFSPDGTTLASGSGDGTIRLWDAATGDHIRTLMGAGAGFSVAFSPDGTTIISSDWQGRLSLWELAPVYSQEDTNQDGVVNIIDLTFVASNFGKTGKNAADVNGDGHVNIQDLVAVAAAFGGAANGAPAAPYLSPETLQHWIAEAQHLTDSISQRGLGHLEILLDAMLPKETALLRNYPNPFNPETWIPFQLAKPTDVSVSIYNTQGAIVRTLNLGHLAAGVYQHRSRAAYWDGKNELGEPVASGVYFYTLTAGEFTATQKMVIRK